MTVRDTGGTAEWVEIIFTALCYAPADSEAAILAEVGKRIAERKAHPFRPYTPQELLDEVGPDFDSKRHFDIAARLVLMLVRTITNNNAAADADEILFQQFPGPGSGRLIEYLSDLPSLKRLREREQRKQAS